MAGRGGVAERVAAAQHASVESLVAYASDSSPAVRRTVAARPDAPGEALHMLIADRDLATREAVARSPAVPEDGLITLLADRHWRVRLTAASNPAATLSARRAMCVATDPDIRLVLAQQPGLPVEIGEALARDESFKVRDALAQCTDQPAVLETLLTDRDGRVRGSAGMNSLTTVPQLLALRHDKDWRARNAVVWANSDGREVPVEDLLALARDRSVNVRWWLANLPGATREVYEILSRDNDETVSATAQRWLLPPDDPGYPTNHKPTPTFLDSLVTRTNYSDPARLGEPTPHLAAIPDELTQLPREELIRQLTAVPPQDASWTPR
jgi:Leucine rich repeat variant